MCHGRKAEQDMRVVRIGYRANYGLKANLDVGPIDRYTNRRVRRQDVARRETNRLEPHRLWNPVLSRTVVLPRSRDPAGSRDRISVFPKGPTVERKSRWREHT